MVFMKSENVIEKINNSALDEYPFKHIVIENLIEATELEELKKDVSELEKLQTFRSYESEYGIKKEWKHFPENLQTLKSFLNLVQGKEIINALVAKFGLDSSISIMADESYDGGGYVISPPGSFLGYHADFNFSSSVSKYRILNVLFYFNENYISDNGGQLHLLDADSKTVEKALNPKINTFLAFLTDDISYHGVSKNHLNFYRRSFNLYFYADKPLSTNQSVNPHKTLWISPEDHNH